MHTSIHSLALSPNCLSRTWKPLVMLGVALFTLPALLSIGEAAEPTKKATKKKEAVTTLVLFDGKTLKGWSKTNFGGEGDVTVEDGNLVIEMGVDLSGITWKDAKKLPKSNYEVSLEAMRVNGNDFFCGLTFPVKEETCSLILGGWGGGVCGLSSIDRMDASENETTSYQTFESKRWYKIRLRVEDERIQAWVDKKQIVDQKIKGRKISIRNEVELSKPLGFATWQTTAALRNVKLRTLPANEKKPATSKPARVEEPKD